MAAIFFAQVAMAAVNLCAAAIAFYQPPGPGFPGSAPVHPSHYTASPGYVLSAAFAGAAVGFRLAWRRAA